MAEENKTTTKRYIAIGAIVLLVATIIVTTFFDAPVGDDTQVPAPIEETTE